ncbi:ESX secretion-associated protein EspG [Nocardia carnea]|nr:ESX secretion-associated protein EspG [Nocardia carnea]
MGRSWTLTGLEFSVLWEDLREVSLPAPFTYLSDARSFSEWEREERDARSHLQSVDKYGLGDVLDIVARPDLQVVLHAWDPRAGNDPATHIRLHAVRRGPRTYLLQQLPGESVQHSGGFTITECGHLALAELIAARLPDREPGRFDSLPIPGGKSLEANPGESLVRELPDDPQTAAGVEFIRKPKELTGAVEVRQGLSPLGPKYRARRGFWLYDLVDDGRYLVIPGRQHYAVGVDTSKISDRINTLTAEVIAAITEQRRGVAPN